MRAPAFRMILPLFLLLPTGRAAAQEADVQAMVRRIFVSRDFEPERFGPARWLENGSAYTTIEPSEAVSDAQDIVRYDTATGAREVLISARQLTPRGGKSPLEIEDYGWSPDGTKLLVFTNTQRV